MEQTLTAYDIGYLYKLMNICVSVGINDVVIRPDMISGISEDNRALMIHTENIPQFQFGTMCILDCKSLLNRLNLVYDKNDGFEGCIGKTRSRIHKDAEYVFFLTIRSPSGSEVEFRCALPLMSKSKTKFKDSTNPEEMNTVELESEVYTALKKSKTAMTSLFAYLDFSENNFQIRVEDADENKFVIQPEVKYLHTANAKSFKFDINRLISFCKYDVKHFDITPKGILSIKVDGFQMYVIQEI